jgi:hypothetical protein
MNNIPPMTLSGSPKSLTEIKRSDLEGLAIQVGLAAEKVVQLDVEIPNLEHGLDPPAYFQNPLNDF